MKVIFDWDNTLIDNNDLSIQVINTILIEYKIPPLSEDEKKSFNCWYSIKNLCKNRKNKIVNIEEIQNQYKKRGREIHLQYPLSGKPFSYSKEILNYLQKEKHEILLITSKNKENLYKELDKWEMKKYFSKIIPLGEIGEKPNIDIKNLNADIFIGDSLYFDMLCCINNNIKGILINNEFPEMENENLFKLIKNKIIHIKNTKELLPLIKKM